MILVPFSRIAGPLQQVFFPAFSRISDDRERMADIWIRATRLVALISIPALVGLAIVAPDFVEVVLGPKWSEATPVIQILASVGLIQSLQTLSGEVLLALGRANWLFRFTIAVVRRQPSPRSRSACSGASSASRPAIAVATRARRAAADVPREPRARDLAVAVRRARSRASPRRRR